MIDHWRAAGEAVKRLKSPLQVRAEGEAETAKLLRLVTERGNPSEGRVYKTVLFRHFCAALARHGESQVMDSRVEMRGGQHEWGKPSKGVGVCFQPGKAYPIRSVRLATMEHSLASTR